MKPSAEKMAKPATKLVPLFRRHKYTQSLKQQPNVKKVSQPVDYFQILLASKNAKDIIANSPVTVVVVLIVTPKSN